MRIIVTKEDIENGRARDAQNCPVALALRRAGVGHFGVSGILVWVASGNQAVVLPGPVQEWILNFDYGCRMAPIEFELNLAPCEEREKVVVPPRDAAWKLQIDLLGDLNVSPEPVRIRLGRESRQGGPRRGDYRRSHARELVGV